MKIVRIVLVCFIVLCSTLTVVGSVANRVKGIVPNSLGFSYPFSIAVTFDGTTAYACNAGNNCISVIDVASNNTTSVITSPYLSNPVAIAITPNNNYAYVTNTGSQGSNPYSDNVVVVDLQTNQVVQNIQGYFSHPSYIAINPAGTKAYVPNGANNVAVLDITTPANTIFLHNVTDTSNYLDNPGAIVITPNGLTAYVANNNNGVNYNIVIIDLTGDDTTGIVDDSALSSLAGVTSMVITPDGSKVYAANNYSFYTISYFLTSTNTITNVITLPGDYPTGFNPYRLSLSSDGTTLAVTAIETNSESSVIYVINTSTEAITYTIDNLAIYENNSNFYGIAVIPGSTSPYIAYATCPGKNPILIADLTEGTITGQVRGSYNQPYGIAINSTGTKAYATYYGDVVSVINIETGLVTDSIFNNTYPFSSPTSIAINADNTTAYVVNNTGDNVNIVNLTNNTITGYINSNGNAFNTPNSIAIAPTLTRANGTTAYVTNTGGNNVSIINLTTNTVTGYVTAGSYPFSGPTGIAISADGTTAYVANSTGNNVSIINLTTNTVTGYVNNNGFAFSGPSNIAINPIAIGGVYYAYVTNQTGNNVSILNTKTNTVRGYVTGSFYQPGPVAITADGTTAYVGNLNNNTINVIQTQTNTVTGTVSDVDSTIRIPEGIAFTPNATLAFVTNFGNGSISIVQVELEPFIPVDPPTSVAVQSVANSFLTHLDLMNQISWQEPTSGTTPVQYNIYTDQALTQLVGIIFANDSLRWYAHNCIPGKTYSYYLVSIDSNGNVSDSVAVTITAQLG